jgi:hypothetical protein
MFFNQLDIYMLINDELNLRERLKYICYLHEYLIITHSTTTYLNTYTEPLARLFRYLQEEHKDNKILKIIQKIININNIERLFRLICFVGDKTTFFFLIRHMNTINYNTSWWVNIENEIYAGANNNIIKFYEYIIQKKNYISNSCNVICGSIQSKKLDVFMNLEKQFSKTLIDEYLKINMSAIIYEMRTIEDNKCIDFFKYIVNNHKIVDYIKNKQTFGNTSYYIEPSGNTSYYIEPSSDMIYKYTITFASNIFNHTSITNDILYDIFLCHNKEIINIFLDYFRLFKLNGEITKICIKAMCKNDNIYAYLVLKERCENLKINKLIIEEVIESGAYKVFIEIRKTHQIKVNKYLQNLHFPNSLYALDYITDKFKIENIKPIDYIENSKYIENMYFTILEIKYRRELMNRKLIMLIGIEFGLNPSKPLELQPFGIPPLSNLLTSFEYI